MLKQLLCKILGLDPATATEEEITAKANAFKVLDTAAHDAELKAEKDKVIAANSELATAKADAEKFRKLAINAKTTSAVNARKITAAEVPAWETRLATNFDDGAKELDAKSETLPNDPLKLGKGGADLTTPAARQLAFNAAIEPYIAKGLGIDVAIASVRATPEGAALLKAMEPAA